MGMKEALEMSKNVKILKVQWKNIAERIEKIKSDC